MKISYGKTVIFVLVNDAFKGCHYSPERPGNIVLRSEGINNFGLGVEEIFPSTKKKSMVKDIFK